MRISKMDLFRFTNLKVKDGLTELSLPKIQTDMLKDYDRQVLSTINTNSYKRTMTKTQKYYDDRQVFDHQLILYLQDPVL